MGHQKLRVLLGCLLGLFIGFGSSFSANSAVFSPALGTAFGWDRFTSSLSYSAGLLGMALASPFVGRLIDRYGAKKIIYYSLFLYTALLATMSLQNGHPALWVILSLLIGISGAATSALGFLVILPSWFDKRLGFALAVAMLGSGLGMVVIPYLTHRIIGNYGWSNAYLILSATVLLLGLLALQLIVEKPALPTHQNASSSATDNQGLSLQQALRSIKFWLMIFVFFSTAIATLGLTPHLIVIYSAKGITPELATSGASTVGLGVLFGRVITGLLLDKIPAHWVAFGFFMCAAVGLFLFAYMGFYPLLLTASLLLGLAIGAEGDLISYMVRVYFGLKSLASIVGIIFGAYSFGAIFGPLILGWSYDTYDSFYKPLIIFSALMLLTSIACLFLGRPVRQA